MDGLTVRWSAMKGEDLGVDGEETELRQEVLKVSTKRLRMRRNLVVSYVTVAIVWWCMVRLSLNLDMD
jgi:hypothetical protein